jgi:hypothetical protein
MNVLNHGNGQYEILLSEDELIMLNDCVSETYNGLDIREF